MPNAKGFTARPTTDFAKESLFNILFNYFDFEEKEVLDLFSGTGGIAYEFASRGCKKVVCIENEFRHYKYIKQTIEKLNIKEIILLKLDVFKYIKESQQQFNIIFADPPYALENLKEIPDLVLGKNLLKDRGMFVLEHPKSIQFNDHPRFMLHRNYGSVNFSFFE